MQRRYVFFNIVLILSLTSHSFAASKPLRQARDKPNIIVFLADDLGYADVGFNGCQDIPTPHIDSIAKNGARFTDGYANHPVCSPSRAGLLSGMYQHRFGFENNSGPEEYAAANFGVPREIPILAERLSQAGYATCMVGKWHIGFKEGLRPHERGFDYTYGFLSGARTYYPKGPRQNNQLYRNGQEFDDETEYLTDAFARDSVNFIDRHRQSDRAKDPFFLFFSFNAVHLPLEATKKYESRFPAIKNPKRKTYAGMLSALDDAIGRVMDKVRDHQLENDTLVFFYSDNGGPTTKTTSKNDPLRGFKGQMFEGGIRIPFAVQWLGTIAKGKEFRHPVMGFDVHATALAAAGIEVPKKEPLDGKNLVPYLSGTRSGPPHEKLFWRSGTQHAARVGDWKLVKMRGSPEMLYDLSRDIGEQNDLANSDSEKLNELRAAYAAWDQQMEPPRWKRQDRTNAEVGGKLKESRTSPAQDPATRLELLFRNDVNGDDRLTRKEYQEPYAKTKKFQSNWNSMKDFPVPRWFDDAKFGIFIHWGPYSVLGYRKGGRGYSEHVPKMIYSDPEHYYPYLQSRFGAHPPEFGYKDIIARFKAEKFNPKAWAKLFESSGAKYVVLTAEHHDGYAMWDSDLTDWCATKVGPLRDLVGELGAAVREQGLKYAPSYHRERHTGFFAKDLYAIRSQPRPDVANEIQLMPSASKLYGPFEYDDAFIDDYVARWKEIQTKYHPDFMWIDDIPIFTRAPNDPQTEKFLQACCEMIADFLNNAADRGQEVYLNNKGKTQNWPVNLGCLEKDNLQMSDVGPKWENPATLGTSYGYMRAEEVQDLYKTPQKLIHLLCDVVSKNGNLLLNIGPRGDGTIPEGMQQRLLEIGKWLETNGEAIYGTRAWTVFGEGVTDVKNKKDAKGRHTINSTGIRFTRSLDGDTLYAILLECPEEEVIVESLKNVDVPAVELLGSDDQLHWKSGRAGLTVQLPAEKPCDHAYVLRIGLR